MPFLILLWKKKNRLEDQLGDREKRQRRESATNQNGRRTSNLPLLSPSAEAVIAGKAFSQEAFRGCSQHIRPEFWEGIKDVRVYV